MTSPHFVPGLSLTPEQVERRRSSIGASDMPAVLGMSNYKSTVQLWAEKRGLIPMSSEGNENTEWGTRLEAVVADAYAEKQNVGVERCETIVIPEGWRSATPDRKVYDLANHQTGPAVFPWLRMLEVKCRGDFNADEFGEPGTDQIPDEVAIQVHSTMSVLRVRGIILERADVATLIGGNRFRSYIIPYDPQLDADLTEAAYNFWHHHVLTGVEPPLDRSMATQRYLQDRFAKNTEVIMKADIDQDAMIASLLAVRAEKKELEAQENGIKNRLMSIMGTAAVLQGVSGRIDWKAPKGNTVAWSDIASKLNAPAELIAQHSTPMVRRFVPYPPKKK